MNIRVNTTFYIETYKKNYRKADGLNTTQQRQPTRTSLGRIATKRAIILWLCEQHRLNEVAPSGSIFMENRSGKS